jgi:3'-phosphoadenosine 5'-phosphosulfate sulfotransferase (PAPS reductase)/FAD synthetase
LKHIVGFSGGIDSQAVTIWVRNRFPAEDIILLNTTAGENENSLTMAFVKQYSETVFPVITIPAIYADLWKTVDFAETKGLNSNDVLTFEGMIKVKGRPPSRKAQFCTMILKLQPQKRWIADNVTDDYERYTGVRRDESDKRKNTPIREFDEFFDCYLNNPLADWTKKMCFDYVEAHGEEYNPLYKLGFNRVGCAPCINSNKDDIRMWNERFPEDIEKIRRYERNTGRTYFSPILQKGVPNTIDEVVRWAYTAHGGHQIDMIKITEERPNCESKYGLCE